MKSLENSSTYTIKIVTTSKPVYAWLRTAFRIPENTNTKYLAEGGGDWISQEIMRERLNCTNEVLKYYRDNNLISWVKIRNEYQYNSLSLKTPKL